MIVDEALWLLDVDDFKKMERRLLVSSKVGNVHACCTCWRRHHCGSGCVAMHVLRSSAEQMLRRSEQPCACTALGVSLDAVGAATNLDEVVNGDRLMKDGGRSKKVAQRRRLASSRPTRPGWQHTAAALLASLLAWP